jgi:hypothetical protein
VDVVRLSPQSGHMAEVIRTFDAVRNGTLRGRDAAASLAPLLPAEACNGYWYGKPGLEYRMENAA